MPIVSWLVIGLVSGLFASKIVNRSGTGIIVDIVLGIVGATCASAFFSAFGVLGYTGLNIYSLVISTIGSVVLLTIFHVFLEKHMLDKKLSADPFG
jgi:uncharacterized membrane protein YeaQ/YmgE (transglycosylase-associated protein family)